MKNTIYAVVSVDHGDTCDGIPRKLGQFDTKNDAIEYIKEDMRSYCDRYTQPASDGKTVGPLTYDENKFFIENCDGTESCQWAIIEVEAN